jgi:hypothetical protein
MKPFAEQKGRVYTEDDWLPQTEEDCEKAEKDEKYVQTHLRVRMILTYSPMAASMWYCASKKYAEIAAFETQKRVGAKYTLAAINPPSKSSHLTIISGLTDSDPRSINPLRRC